MKRNKAILLCLLLILRCAGLAGQEYTTADSVPYIDDTLFYESDDAESYDPSYHFNESAQHDYNLSPHSPKLDSAHWKSLVKNLDFNEGKKAKDTSSKKNKAPQAGGKDSSKLLPSNLKYLWITLALIILILIVLKFLPMFSQRNLKNKDKLVISLDELDEDQIKALDVETPLQQALRNGDYRTAYRLRYLSVIKLLISRNLILYRKEKTNYEYLLQLSGKDIYEPFRQLTFNFDGIWYGDLAIDKAKYEGLDQYFVTFHNVIKS